MDMKRFFLYFITIAALTLAGCGGGGGGTSLMVGGERATQPDIDALAQSLTDAQGERDTAKEMLTDVQMALDAASTSVEDLTAAVTNLEDMRNEYQGKVNAATVAIAAALGAAATDDLAVDIATLNQMLTDESGNAAMAKATLDTVQTELDAESTSTEDLTAAIDSLETMGNNYRTMVSQVRDALDLDGMADVDDIVMAIQDLQSDGLLTDVQDLQAAAESASRKATGAVADATFYSDLLTATASDDKVVDDDGMDKTITIAVNGDSRKAGQHAQNVLDAYQDAKDAETSAKEVRDDLETLKEDFENDQDIGNRTALEKAIEEAIDVAKKEVEDTEDIAGSRSLANARKAVVGGTGDEGYPRGREYHAKQVAMDIGSGLMINPGDEGARIMPQVTKATVPAGATLLPKDDHQGETWEDIVGSSNISPMRIDADDPTEGTTVVVPAAAIVGMVATSIVGFDVDTTSTANGVEYSGNYDGIMGIIFCADDDCGTTTKTDGTFLSGSWYFTPNEPDISYVDDPDNTGQFMVETMFARYGYWLADSIGGTIIHTYAVSGANQLDLDVTTVHRGPDATTLTDTSAVYRGDAVGLSLHKEVNSDGMVLPGTLVSGQFTAKVELTAAFNQTDPTLGGRVYNFQGAGGTGYDNVDSDWEVNLLSGVFAGATLDDGTASANSSPNAGVWSAAGYGPSGGRPEGIFGTFNAHFSDGHAAGAYTTRK